MRHVGDVSNFPLADPLILKQSMNVGRAVEVAVEAEAKRKKKKKSKWVGEMLPSFLGSKGHEDEEEEEDEKKSSR